MLEQVRVAQRLTSLDDIEEALWQELGHCVHERDHDWRRCVLASSGEQGADARLVVLREVDREARELMIYTDTRSPKVAQLQRDRRATLVCWSAALGWQLRLRGEVEVACDGLQVTSRWATIKHRPAAQDYLSPLAPGSEWVAGGKVDHPREHFGVMTLQVQSVDWLEVHALGHRRAMFDARGRRWLAP
ncbi:pyridoxamine 5'-phosphate oxidase family protein [Sphaerotilus microaerophilus]|uniref:Pyridoxamine 5'-phosphate oxidase Alr4036 family FMN-binding domain-containing protein n=1 Tax=Sphaerotilus microaerophilus TaxID=2914710 RepID=A0ABM7YGU7_9BURK|nr:pyridoxamine 5'-phosphate oxidase family protein [Sphaerotilus sp. FB-5]BDI03481.1 hypothetical protein CATMQ487_04510 [Sphaerotilus sp. FB-5]